MSFYFNYTTITNVADLKGAISEYTPNFREWKSDEKDLYSLASTNKLTDIMKYLEDEYNWDVNTKFGNFKLTPFLDAVMNGDWKTLKYLKNRPNVDFTATDNRGNNALLMAAMCGLDMFKYIVENFDFDIHSKNNFGSDVYLIASCQGSVDVMKHLETEYNWDINVCTNDGENGYYLAAWHKNIQGMEYFEEKEGYDLLKKTKSGKNVCDFEVHKVVYHLKKIGLLPDAVVESVSKKIQQLNDSIDTCEMSIKYYQELIEEYKAHIVANKKKLDEFKDGLREICK